MALKFLTTTMTPDVLAAQEHYYGRAQALPPEADRDPLGAEEVEFIARRDSFYMATVTSDGWPYIQHRGGSPGFLKVVNPHSLAFADYKGNRQLLSTGNLTANNRVALFSMDYPRRERLKILGHACVEDARERPELVEQLADAPERRLVERLLLIDVVSFDWNCPKYITPRYSEEEVRQAVEPLKRRVAELERAVGKANAKRG
jgi:uncharacterized protein